MFLNSPEKLELNKILLAVSGYASLEGGKRFVLGTVPSTDIAEVRRRLSLTRESTKLLYTYGVGKIGSFGEPEEILSRAAKGSALSCGEILEVCALLRSAREAYSSVSKISDEEINLIKTYTDRLCFDRALEDDITEKILSDDTVCDYASDRLFSVRSKIRSLNEKIRK